MKQTGPNETKLADTRERVLSCRPESFVGYRRKLRAGSHGARGFLSHLPAKVLAAPMGPRPVGPLQPLDAITKDVLRTLLLERGRLEEPCERLYGGWSRKPKPVLN